MTKAAAVVWWLQIEAKNHENHPENEAFTYFYVYEAFTYMRLLVESCLNYFIALHYSVLHSLGVASVL